MAVATQIVVLPAPPRPQPEWTQDYANQMNRWLTQIQLLVTSIHYLQASGLYLSPDSFPTSGYGLRAGEVFANDGILTWVRLDDIWAGAFSISAELGTLTVTT